MIRYTRRMMTKDNRSITLKIFTTSRRRFFWHFLRAWYEFGRGNSYEYNDIW